MAGDRPDHPRPPQCPFSGPEVYQKWTGSGPEVYPSVLLSVRLSTIPLPPSQTLCEGSTSAGHLRPAIFQRSSSIKPWENHIFCSIGSAQKGSHTGSVILKGHNSTHKKSHGSFLEQNFCCQRYLDGKAWEKQASKVYFILFWQNWAILHNFVEHFKA